MRLQQDGSSSVTFSMLEKSLFAERKVLVQEAPTSERRMVFGQSFAGCKSLRPRTLIKPSLLWLLRKLCKITGLSTVETIIRDTTTKVLKPQTPRKFSRESLNSLVLSNKSKKVTPPRSSSISTQSMQASVTTRDGFSSTRMAPGSFSENPELAHQVLP